MYAFKTTLTPVCDSVKHYNANFTAGKKYPAVSLSTSKPLYQVKDDRGAYFVVDAESSLYLGGKSFIVNIDCNSGFATGGYAKAVFDSSLISSVSQAMEYAENTARQAIKFEDRVNIVADMFKVHIPAKEEELQKEVERLTGELSAAHNTIAKIREIMRTEPGEDVQNHAKVLRQMADALVNLWRGEK